jgi:hypothetical protein
VTAPAVVRRFGQPIRGSLLGAAALEHVAPLRRRAPLAALLATGLVVHGAVAPHLAVRGLAPDVLLVAVVAVAAGRGARAGAAFGFAAGMGADLFLATPLGTSALASTLLGHLVGRWSRPPAATTAAAAICSPASTCFACRTGRHHRSEATSRRRRVAARRAALRQAIVVVLLGVAAGRLGAAVVATALGGLPFPDTAGVLRMAGVAALSAPLGPPVLAAVHRLGRASGAGR